MESASFITFISCNLMVLSLGSGSQAQAEQDTLYITNGSHILQSNPVTGVHTPLDIPSDQIGRAVGLAVDAQENLVFWSDVSYEKKGIYVWNNTHSVKIISDVAEVNGVTVDWTTNHIYWTDAGRKTIEVADYDGRNRRILISSGLSRPRGIVADPVSGYLFWGDQGTRRLERTRLDGSGRIVLPVTGLFWPNQLTVNYTDGRLLWVDGANKTLNSCDRDGSSVNMVANFSMDSPGPLFGVAVSNTDPVVYVTSWYSGQVMNVSTEGQVGKALTNVAAGNAAIFSVASTFQPSVNTAQNPCMTSDRGQCAGLCLPTGADTYRCSCGSYGGLSLGQDGRSCRTPQKVLLFALADVGEVGYLDLEGATGSPDHYTIGHSPRPVAVAYDAFRQIVYWSDVSNRAIYSASLQGGARREILNSSHSIGIVDGLAYDSAENRLYFSNMGIVSIDSAAYSWHRIEMVDLDSGQRQTVVNVAQKPRAIWIDQVNRYLYYSDWGDRAAIMRTDLDGGNPEKIGTSQVSNPNSILIEGNHLYYVDSQYKDSTLSAGLHSVDLRTQTTSKKNVNLKVPFGLAKDSSTIYISDWGSSSLVTYNDETAETATRLSGLGKIMGLLVTPVTAPTSVPSTMPCRDSDCEEICLPKPLVAAESAVCSCNSYNYTVLQSDGKQCAASEDFVLFADMNSIKLVSLNPVTRRVQTVIQGNSFYSNFAALVYDSTSKTMYFSDVNRQVIFKANIDGTNVQQFYNPGHIIDSMVLSGGRLYWTEFAGGSIVSVALNGDNRTYTVHVTGLDRPRAVQVHDTGSERYLYWSEWGTSDRRVGRVRLGVSTPLVQTVLTSSAGLRWTNSLQIVADKLYVADGYTKTVYVANLDGSGLTELTQFRSDHIYDISLGGDWIYFTDWRSKRLSVYHRPSGRVEVLAEGLMRPTQMVVQQAEPTPTECPSSHGCSQCYPLTGSSWLCGCPAGQVLLPDGKSCSNTVSTTTPYPDTESPVFTFCPMDLVKDTTSGSVHVTWPSPEARDNMAVTSLTSNYKPGNAFPVGESTVTYTVEDAAGNTASCSFTVVVKKSDQTKCGRFETPHRASVSCQTVGGQEECTITCTPESNIRVNQQVAQQYTCDAQGTWQPEYRADVVRTMACVEIKSAPVSYGVKYQEVLTPVGCYEDQDFISFVKNKYIDWLRVNEVCPKYAYIRLCQPSQLDVSCGTVRKKRQTSTQDGTMTIVLALNATLPTQDSQEDFQTVQEVAKNVSIFLANNQFVFSYNNTNYNVTLKSQSSPTVNCGKGQMKTVDNFCVPCPPGTRYSSAQEMCLVCPENTYQERSGQSACIPCEAKKNSLAGSFSHSDCTAHMLQVSSPEPDIRLIIAIAVGSGMAVIILIVIVVILCRGRRGSTKFHSGSNGTIDYQYENEAYDQIPADHDLGSQDTRNGNLLANQEGPDSDEYVMLAENCEILVKSEDKY
ncbi:low-density lipoprotein receptor-related protein 4-like [Lingula anatina]|uniref:Low-density lipoprotein receptor-related protein 4-like n=1 Tax=Lingula anatina TaxID=7574 RepID=A0A1S3HBB0_LINAN|nr:low-density lipoprotein receptor-related protein 4-like [Lingula anatina]|eukprot:XP_013382434.1 low-density lipoprotein receptor-related protein 4-like [Lingula anatina]